MCDLSDMDLLDNALSSASEFHAPVLVREVCELLCDSNLILDGTLGGGGHSEALLLKGHRVVGVDRDMGALKEASQRLKSFIADGRFEAVFGNHDAIDSVGELEGRSFDGILLDLGVSSHQLDSDGRGFSFRPGVELDMRMDQSRGDTAAEYLNTVPEGELAEALRDYGDEPKARRMAREIVRRRERKPFEISDDLVGAIRSVLGPRSGASDFARIFQAVRIVVNDEIGGIRTGLAALRDRLSPGGVIAVITYHSGEDRAVKQAFREWSSPCTCPPRAPVCMCGAISLGEAITRKPIVPRDEEMSLNPRARSAHLRAWRRASDDRR